MAEIQLRGVTKRFDGVAAVRGASFTIRDGEFFVLVGPSGCGKSTLLNLIVGLEDVTEGEVLVDGEDVTGLDPKDRNMAMVFQSYALYPHMNVRQNLEFPLKIAKLSAEEIERRVARTAGVLELKDLLDRKPGALSGGQRQRVAMGRAIVREPRAFLLDEPLSNLDARLRVQMRTEIARLQRKLGTTTVYVTHDQTEAMTLGDRIAVLRAGEILQVGTPREIYERPATLFVAGFIGTPPMNFLPARLEAGRLDLPVGSMKLPSGTSAPDGPLIAAFRPEDFEVADPSASGAGLRFDVRAEIVEWQGADLLVYFEVSREGFEDAFMSSVLPDESGARSLGARTLVARAAGGTRVREGDIVHFRLDSERVQVFDPDSGKNLTPRP